MSKAPRFPRQARWAVPFGAVAVVGVVAAGSVLTSAQAAPALPARTPAQLVAAIAANHSLPPLSGVITSDAALGLPDLPATGGPATGGAASIPSLLAGSHTTEVWYAGPGQFRLAVPVTLGETDLRADGRQVWLWDSKTNTATHIKLPAGPGGAASGPGSSLPSRGSFYPDSKARPSSAAVSSSGAYQSTLAITLQTPQQVARRLLAMLGPTTTVSVQSNVTVAGQPAYQLVLAPKNSGSLIGRVSIAVDASRYVPLRVQVFARDSASPAFQVGYTSISFARPAESNFTFTPPPGAKVKTIMVPAGLAAGPAGIAGPLGALSGGIGGGFVHFPKGVATHRMGTAKGGAPASSISVGPGLPKQLPKGQRQRLMKLIRRDVARARRLHPGSAWHGAGWYGYAPTTGGTFPPGAASAPRVIGSGWTAVAVLPAAGLTAGPAGGEAGALLRSATPVHGTWGSGRLLRTSLLSVLITSNGKALIGAVAPSVLYAAAPQAK